MVCEHGLMGCCVDGELSRTTARAACTQTIHEAIETGLQDGSFGVVVDALPTLGKSRTVATLPDDLRALAPAGEDLHITILTHRKETRNQVEAWAADAGFDAHQLPIFDDDCPTAAGEFGATWADRVHDLRSRGISPRQLHVNPTHDLPCSAEQPCAYVTGWEDCRDARVLIGHPIHAYVAPVVRDRVVIFDEDPGEAFRTDFDGTEIHRVVSEYLSETDELPSDTDDDSRTLTSRDDLIGYREYGSQEQVDATLATLRADTLFSDSALVGRTGGHGAARAVALAFLETDRKDMGNDAERVILPDGAVAVYDDTDGKLYIRRPPDLSSAAAVIGLDGTPTRRIWEGRLGCPADQGLDFERVLCDDCRHRYLAEVLGYRISQTTTHVKPYSSGHNLHTEKDLALIEAVYRETAHEPAVITTKVAEQAMAPEWSHVQASGHYGAIKGSNRFEGEDVTVGIVLGSQHPGDHEIKRLAALNGDTLDISEKLADRGKNLTYGVAPRPGEPTDPYLSHFRDHQVVQAIFRFGRRDGATVFVHTGAVPDWILTAGPIDSEREVFRRARQDGERHVMSVLEAGEPLTTEEIAERVPIAQRTVYDRLNDLEADGLAEQLDATQPHRWRLTDTEPNQDAGHLVADRWYVSLPSLPASSAD